MQDFSDKKILLGVCAGIAAYKVAYLLRELTQLGATVRVVMTEAAKQFITPLTLQSLSGQEVRFELFDTQAERGMSHIELARWADYLLIAPASANVLAKMAHGMADDLLSTLYLVTEIPVIVCPAMNHSMWRHSATQKNCDILRERGVIFIGPDEGAQACGEYGLGRMAEVEAIVEGLRLYNINGLLLGKRICITAGPTQEAIDPVRYLTNHSSGKMGYALAKAAQMAGAEVIMISGPTSLPKPLGVRRFMVTTGKEMYAKVMELIQEDMIFIAAAAVADYYVPTYANEKLKKKSEDSLTLTLLPNPDILATVAQDKKASLVVGFAAETNNVLDNAINKLNSKHADLIIANQVGNGLGFNTIVNQITLVTKNKQIELPLMHKTRLAGEIIAFISTMLAK